MLEQLKQEVYEANMMLPHLQLVTFTWGNVSGIDRERGLMVIKPSGVPYEQLSPDIMCVVDMQGNSVEGKLRASCDAPTHIGLYKHFPAIGGITHTHSVWATAWAQAGQSIPPMGTTHADNLPAEIPVTRSMTPEELGEGFEARTAEVIAECFSSLDPNVITAVLVKWHAPFTWGASPEASVNCAALLEQIAKMAALTKLIGGNTSVIDPVLLNAHYQRKHGENAYYGQK